MGNERIFLKLEKFVEGDIKLELDFERDNEKNAYIMGIASTPDKNSAGYIVDNEALLEAWQKCKAETKNVAVYEKHTTPVGKMVGCQGMNGKILVVLEIPKPGNERLLALYEQGIYIGLSIGGWALDGTWDDKDIFHVTEFEWNEVSLTDNPSNENALLLEFANSKRPVVVAKLDNSALSQMCLQKVIDKIKGD